jgi:hypothetical protein
MYSTNGASRRSYDVSLAVPIFRDKCFVTHKRKDLGVSDCCLSTMHRPFVFRKEHPTSLPTTISRCLAVVVVYLQTQMATTVTYGNEER